eukprot:scaffold9769_cov29-Tisochrysis_lutea.AAC.5
MLAGALALTLLASAQPAPPAPASFLCPPARDLIFVQPLGAVGTFAYGARRAILSQWMAEKEKALAARPVGSGSGGKLGS